MLCNNYFVSYDILNDFFLFHNNLLQTPPPLCDFEQWIDTEIKSEDNEWMQKLLRWEAEDKEMMEKRQRGGTRKGARGRGGKEACCCVQGGEGEEA